MSVLELFNDEQRLEIKNELRTLVADVVSEVLKEHVRTKSKSLSVEEAREVLGLGRAKLMNLVEQGKIPYRMNGNRYIFDESDLEYFKSKMAIRKTRKGIKK